MVLKFSVRANTCTIFLKQKCTWPLASFHKGSIITIESNQMVKERKIHFANFPKRPSEMASVIRVIVKMKTKLSIC